VTQDARRLIRFRSFNPRWTMRAVVLLLLFLGCFTLPAFAGEAEIAVLRLVLAPGPVDLSLFGADFLKAVPADQIRAAVEPIKTMIGPVAGIEPRGGTSYAIETATHEMLADIALDAHGKIAGLLLHPPLAKSATIVDLLKELSAIAPKGAYLVSKNGTPVYSSNPDVALAVASAFKLGILKALRDDIGSGTRKWSDVVTLTAGDISLPSGVLQSWPVGSPLTLHTLAAEMISISDNTAADTLLRVVGRDKVEAALGIAPVLTTRELFTLKASPELKAKYQVADLAGKRAVMAELDALPLPDLSKGLPPLDEGVEYYLSPTTLCGLMRSVADLDVTQINPGVAQKADWRMISFKGGSEVGVLSLTTSLVDSTGTKWCVSAVWNAPGAIDEAKAMAAYAGVLSKLSKG
jgi:beta-lactamase class A